ncbi:MAG: Trm112 family protein [Candidatus Helarchaeota archaeon]
MKPLLLDILACPICKYYPLQLYILKWETPDNKFSKIIAAYQNNDLDYLKKVTKIRRGKDRIDDAITISQNGNCLIRDEIVRKNSDLVTYLKDLKPKFENFHVMEDFTAEPYSSCLKLIKTEVINTMEEVEKELSQKGISDLSLGEQKNFLDRITREIYLLNWFFQFSEIEEGIIYCEKCKRWYPIIETIPQMLPDELREKEPEIQFLEKWSTVLPAKITKEGNPFHLE